MNKSYRYCESKKLLIPTSELYSLVEERNTFYSMLSNIIVLFKQEDKLKKHHRPYLHVRDEIDKLCDEALQYIGKMRKQTKLHEIHVSDAMCEHCVCENAGKSAADRGEVIEIVDTLVGDLISLVEYVDVLRHMMYLLAAGVELGEATDKFNRFLNEEFDEMMERWEKTITGMCHESK